MCRIHHTLQYFRSTGLSKGWDLGATALDDLWLDTYILLQKIKQSYLLLHFFLAASQIFGDCSTF